MGEMLPVLYPEVIGIETGKGQAGDNGTEGRSDRSEVISATWQMAHTRWRACARDLSKKKEKKKRQLSVPHFLGDSNVVHTTGRSSMMLHISAFTVELVVNCPGGKLVGLGTVEPARESRADGSGTQTSAVGETEKIALREHGGCKREREGMMARSRSGGRKRRRTVWHGGRWMARSDPIPLIKQLYKQR